MGKTNLHRLENSVDEAALELFDSVRRWHETSSGSAPINYVELFGLAVLALESINYQLVQGKQRKRLTRRAVGVK